MRCLKRDGFTLIEVMVYTSVLAIVFSLSVHAYLQSQKLSYVLTMSAGLTTKAVQAGEKWRNDIRMAIAEPTHTEEGLHILQSDGAVFYRWREDSVQRRLDGELEWTTILQNAPYSTMVRQDRNYVVSWTWEVALDVPQKHRRPLSFRFAAVRQTGGEE